MHSDFAGLYNGQKSFVSSSHDGVSQHVQTDGLSSHVSQTYVQRAPATDEHPLQPAFYHSNSAFTAWNRQWTRDTHTLVDPPQIHGYLAPTDASLIHRQLPLDSYTQGAHGEHREPIQPDTMPSEADISAQSVQYGQFAQIKRMWERVVPTITSVASEESLSDLSVAMARADDAMGYIQDYDLTSYAGATMYDAVQSAYTQLGDAAVAFIRLKSDLVRRCSMSPENLIETCKAIDTIGKGIRTLQMSLLGNKEKTKSRSSMTGLLVGENDGTVNVESTESRSSNRRLTRNRARL